MTPDENLQAQDALCRAIQRDLPSLEPLLDHVQRAWGSPDLFYRFYHQSFKVYGANRLTADLVAALQALAPDRPLNPWFLAIVADAAGRSFSDEVNARWLEETRPVIEALLHAKMFLELVVQAGRNNQQPVTLLPCGWAAVLYLYQLR